jgi:hypothetical protein
MIPSSLRTFLNSHKQPVKTAFDSFWPVQSKTSIRSFPAFWHTDGSPEVNAQNDQNKQKPSNKRSLFEASLQCGGSMVY